jgi:hypothetical protein
MRTVHRGDRGHDPAFVSVVEHVRELRRLAHDKNGADTCVEIS